MSQDNLYLKRINTVLDYVRANLTDDLSLETLAQVACFSPFHFHRIFTTLVGETVNQCVVRLRLERAAALLKTAPTMSITQAATASGFTSLSVFSRAFKNQYGLSPRSWDRESPLKNSKNGQILEGFPLYTIDVLSDIGARDEFEVRLRPLPMQWLAVVRVFNPYQPPHVLEGYERVLSWYRGRGGQLARTTLYGMSQDDPEITPLELCRYDWCLTLPDNGLGQIESNAEIDMRVFPACTIATIHVEGDIYCVDRAWQYLYRYWLPRSRFMPDNLPAMEIYRQQPAEIGWEIYNLECAVPVIAL